jgi:hypothetical protein
MVNGSKLLITEKSAIEKNYFQELFQQLFNNRLSVKVGFCHYLDFCSIFTTNFSSLIFAQPFLLSTYEIWKASCKKKIITNFHVHDFLYRKNELRAKKKFQSVTRRCWRCQPCRGFLDEI